MAAGDIIVVSEEAGGRKGNYFDGTDDYVLHDAHAVARVAANDTVGTYTAWIYNNLEPTNTTRAILSAGDNDNANEVVYFGIESGKLRIFLKHGGVTQFEVKQSAISIPKNIWTHVAVVQNGIQPVLYVNGIQVATSNTTATDLTMWYDELTLTDKFAIGVQETNATHINDFKGAIGRVKYFALDLDNAEIFVEAQGGTHGARATAIETARVFDISMENDGTTDSGSGADNGTLTGDAHYGGLISDWSYAVHANVTGHAAETINSFIDGNKVVSLIKRGD
ncbi:LamG domain-containing protein [bacterium]|nr:LamG domain-containing protein [bacterium]